MTVTELKTQTDDKVAGIFQRVLVAIDFSEASRRALCYAGRLAAGYPTHLSVLHVSHADWRYEMLDNPPELDLEESDVRRRVTSFLREAGFDKPIDSIRIRQGPVAQQILSAVAQTQTELLMIGTHARGSVQKLALGSVAEEVLRLASCPVMTIGPQIHAEDPNPSRAFSTILFATDFGPGSAKALPLVLALCAAQQARLILLHMMAPMPAVSSILSGYAPATAGAEEVQEWEESSRKRAIQQLKDWLPRQTGLKQEPEYIVGTDFLAEGVLTAAEQHHVDLIVMGAHQAGSARMAAHVPWTAVHEIIRDAHCAVLTVAG